MSCNSSVQRLTAAVSAAAFKCGGIKLLSSAWETTANKLAPSTSWFIWMAEKKTEKLGVFFFGKIETKLAIWKTWHIWHLKKGYIETLIILFGKSLDCCSNASKCALHGGMTSVMQVSRMEYQYRFISNQFHFHLFWGSSCYQEDFSCPKLVILQTASQRFRTLGQSSSSAKWRTSGSVHPLDLDPTGGGSGTLLFFFFFFDIFSISGKMQVIQNSVWPSWIGKNSVSPASPPAWIRLRSLLPRNVSGAEPSSPVANHPMKTHGPIKIQYFIIF